MLKGLMPDPVQQRPDMPVRDPADSYAAAIYGSIVATALVAAFHQEKASPETTILALLSTMAVFWLGHVWSAILGERLHLGRAFDRHRLGPIARSEWPLVEAAFVPAAVLALGWAGVLSSRASLDGALVAGVAQLFAWGFAVGRRVYHDLRRAVLSAASIGMLGLALVGLELLAVH